MSRRCDQRDRYNHRCNQRGDHAEHSAFGRTWTGVEKSKPGKGRPWTFGWSRRGMNESRATILTRIRTAAATAMAPKP